MTVNAFLFSWDQYGIESIVPITQYENWDKENLFRILKDEKVIPNPINNIIQKLVLRARFNSQRHYEIYAIDCDPSLDEEFWREQWKKEPQATADLIRERGLKIHSDRASAKEKILIR